MQAIQCNTMRDRRDTGWVQVSMKKRGEIRADFGVLMLCSSKTIASPSQPGSALLPNVAEQKTRKRHKHIHAYIAINEKARDIINVTRRVGLERVARADMYCIPPPRSICCREDAGFPKGPSFPHLRNRLEVFFEGSGGNHDHDFQLRSRQLVTHDDEFVPKTRGEGERFRRESWGGGGGCIQYDSCHGQGQLGLHPNSNAGTERYTGVSPRRVGGGV